MEESANFRDFNQKRTDLKPVTILEGRLEGSGLSAEWPPDMPYSPAPSFPALSSGAAPLAVAGSCLCEISFT